MRCKTLSMKAALLSQAPSARLCAFVANVRNNSYPSVFLLNWVWPDGPHGAMIGDDVLLQLQDGLAYSVPSAFCGSLLSDRKLSRVAVCRVRDSLMDKASVCGMYLSLSAFMIQKVPTPQHLSVLLASHVSTACAPDGTPCPNVRTSVLSMCKRAVPG